ncbi:MAG: hypothetical protein BWX84_01257 [Verrucomicrobia bacterium ADurb.Bin118]|nr:MAG: hypothetical protein BWX84_01257 [Verrucomicrobia bacterium ADurb.Bin118]
MRACALKRPCRLLQAGNDFQRQPDRLPQGRNQVLAIGGFPCGAGGKEAHPLRAARPGGRHEVRHHRHRARDGVGLQLSRGPEPFSQTRLYPGFINGMDAVPSHLGHEQFHRVGAHINDRASFGRHGVITAATRRLPKGNSTALAAAEVRSAIGGFTRSAVGSIRAAITQTGTAPPPQCSDECAPTPPVRESPPPARAG